MNEREMVPTRRFERQEPPTRDLNDVLPTKRPSDSASQGSDKRRTRAAQILIGVARPAVTLHNDFA